MDAEVLLRSFDGRHVAVLHDIAADLPRSRETVVRLIEAARQAEGGPPEIGATWLVKHLLERGVDIDADIGFRLALTIGQLSENESKLHFLQAIPYVTVTPEAEDALLPVLDAILANATHRFVRAWAYNALGVVARDNPERREDVARRLCDALDVEAPSVKARVRAALRTLAVPDAS